MNSRAIRWVAPVVGVAVLLATWEVWVRWAGVEPYVLPAPSRVARALVDTRDLLPRHIWATVTVALGGLGLGAVVGIAVAAVLTAVPLLRHALQPLLVASQSVPAVVIAPIFIVWFGFGTFPRLLVVALVVFFPIAVATIDGLAGADAELVDLVRAMGGGRLDVLRRVRLPHAAGAFFSGLRIAAAYAMFGAVVAEYMGGTSRGLGVYLLRSQNNFRNDQVFVAVVLIAAVSVVLFVAVAGIARVVTPWRTATTSRPEESR
jgi:NitT/TauT family transport system permease protein